MRRLDGTAGRLACAVLTTARVLRPARRPTEPPRRVAVIKLAEQGATVVAYPAIQRASELVGVENVLLVVFSENRPIVNCMGILQADNILEVRTTRVGTLAVDLVRVVREMRRRRVDTAIDFEFFSRLSACLVFLSGARRRVGLHSFGSGAPWRGDLMTHRVAYNPRWHAATTFDTLVAASVLDGNELPTLDLDPDFRRSEHTPPPRYVPAAGDVDAVESIVGRKLGTSPSSRDLVVLNPNASDLEPLRRWPTDRYVELAQRLIEVDPRVAVVMTGSASEARAAERLATMVGSQRCVSIAGHTSIGELLALYSVASVLVTNDSGPAHFAALTPIEVVTLFGPESPEMFGSTSPRSTAISSGVPCSPCLTVPNGRRSACTNNICMQQISVDSVLEHALAALSRRRN